MKEQLRPRAPSTGGDTTESPLAAGPSTTVGGGSGGGGKPGGTVASASGPMELPPLSQIRRLSHSGSFSLQQGAEEAGGPAEGGGEDKFGLLYTDCAHVLLED